MSDLFRETVDVSADPADKIDFSSFLAAINAVIASAILFLFFSRGPNEYVNTYTVCLSLVFAAQNHFFLLVTRRQLNPFLMLLIMHALFFYEFRVATLLWEPYSVVLPRGLLGAADVNRGLLFIILANFSIFTGVSSYFGKGFEPDPLPENGAGKVNVLLPVLIFSLAAVTKIHPDLFGAFKGYFEVVFTLDILLLLLLVFAARYYRILAGRQKTAMLAMLLIFFVSRTLSGSRSAILTLFFCSFCAWSSAAGRVAFKRRVYVFLAGLIPVAVACFNLASRIRVENASLAAMFDRLGFLDMSTEIISNSVRYRSVINFEYYFKSIVDSGLTPGFNVFDAPKAANALSLIYRNASSISFSALNARYQADVLTVYGEAYALFGYIGGLVCIFVVSFLFQKIYRTISIRDPFKLAALRAMLLYIFYYHFFESCGIDWFVVDLVRGIVPFLIMLCFFSMATKAVPGRTIGGYK